MHLTEREKEDLLVTTAAWLAKERLAKGMKLSYPEAIALITHEVVELARTGTMTVSDLQEHGKHVLTEDDVMDGVENIDVINAHATFPDGTKVIAIYEPFKSANKAHLGEL